jgi:phosphosulfolactate synthase (CoM biosynthesis protein A)
MTKSTPNENILKLRELTKQMSEKPHEKDYEDVIKKVKETIDEGSEKVSVLRNDKSKLKCYEKMYSSIITLLNTIKL